MSYPTGSIPFSGIVGVTAPTDTYPVTTDELNLGGYRCVSSTAARDAITVDRRKFGMMVGVTNGTGALATIDKYVLTDIAGTNDLSLNGTNWVLVSSGGVSLSLTTTGSGAATYVGGVLNIPTMLLEQTINPYLATRLKPANAALTGFTITGSSNLSIGYYAENSSATDTYAIASYVAKGPGADAYTNGISMNFHNPLYWIPYLQNSGSLFSDRQIHIVGLLGIDFRTETDLASATTKFLIGSDGTLTAPAFTIPMINAAGNPALITLEYLNSVIPTSLPPSGPAGGQLAGTYPNPIIANGISLNYPNGTPAIDLSTNDQAIIEYLNGYGQLKFDGAGALQFQSDFSNSAIHPQFIIKNKSDTNVGTDPFSAGLGYRNLIIGHTDNTSGSLIGGPANDSIIFGETNNESYIFANASSMLVFGLTGNDNPKIYNSYIFSNSYASITHGYTYAGTIQNYGTSNHIFGDALNNSFIYSEGTSALTFGSANGGANVATYSSNTLTFGSAQGEGSFIQTNNQSAIGFGFAINGGSINSTGASAITFGLANGSGTVINSTVESTSSILGANLSTNNSDPVANASAIIHGSSSFGLVKSVNDGQQFNIGYQDIATPTNSILAHASFGMAYIEGGSSFYNYGNASHAQSYINANSSSTQLFSNASFLHGSVIANDSSIIVGNSQGNYAAFTMGHIAGRSSSLLNYNDGGVLFGLIDNRSDNTSIEVDNNGFVKAGVLASSGDSIVSSNNGQFINSLSTGNSNRVRMSGEQSGAFVYSKYGSSLFNDGESNYFFGTLSGSQFYTNTGNGSDTFGTIGSLSHGYADVTSLISLNDGGLSSGTFGSLSPSNAGGTTNFNNYGSFAGGYAHSGSTINAYNSGSYSRGVAKFGGTLSAQTDGSSATGYVNGANSAIYVPDFGTDTNQAAQAHGYVNTSDGQIYAQNIGARAEGVITGSGGRIQASGVASWARGWIEGSGGVSCGDLGLVFGYANNGNLSSSRGAIVSGWASDGIIEGIYGGSVFGYVEPSSGVGEISVKPDSKGSTAWGYTNGDGALISVDTGLANSVSGVAYDSSIIQSNSGHANLVHAYATDGSTVLCGGTGNLVGGYASRANYYSSGLGIYANGSYGITWGYVNNGKLQSGGDSNFTLGHADNGGSIVNAGIGSIAGGYVSGTNVIQNLSNGSIAWGSNEVSDVLIGAGANGAMAIGTGVSVTTPYSQGLGKVINVNSTNSFAAGDNLNLFGTSHNYFIGHDINNFIWNNVWVFGYDFNLDNTAYFSDNALYMGWGALKHTFNQSGHGIDSIYPQYQLHIGVPTTGQNGIAQFNTTDQLTNYEVVRQYWSSNQYLIQSYKSGSGVQRDIAVSFGSNSTVGATGNKLSIVNGHFQSRQVNAGPTAATTNFGTGSSVTLVSATDVAGQIQLNEGTGGTKVSGAICNITFNKTYAVPPIVILTPASQNAALNVGTKLVYTGSTTTNFSIYYGNTPSNNGQITVWNYMIIETQ